MQIAVKISVAQPEDFPAWLDLAREVEPLFGSMVEDPTFLRVLRKNINRGTAFCVRGGEKGPGARLLAGLLFSPKPPVYTISWLAVTQEHRRQGIGRRLVEHILQMVERPAEIVVTTFGQDHPGGQPAWGFYERMGFQPAEPAPDGPEGGSRQIFRQILD